MAYDVYFHVSQYHQQQSHAFVKSHTRFLWKRIKLKVGRSVDNELKSTAVACS